MRIGSLAVILFCFHISVYAQIATFRAEVDALEIYEDQYLQVEFVLDNAQGKSFVPPDFKGWTILNGPNTSTQVSIVNGVRNSSISFGYTITPTSLGEVIIGKASIQVNTKTMTTEALKIKVIKGGSKVYQGKKAKEISKKDIFIQAKATPVKAYVGQQIMIEYKLFTAVNVDNYNITHAPEFKGFHVNNIPRLSYDNQEFINGKRYVTKVIHAASVYPLQNGEFEVEPLHARASVITDENENANSFFLLPTTEGINLKSEPLKLQVLSMPSPTPLHFSGAVGKFKMATDVDQLAVKVNDAITITVFIEGDGDLNRVGKPFLNIDSSSFQLYEPKMSKENVDFKTTGFIGMRELIYPVIASAPGMHKIVPSFIYFDTDSQRYVTLASDVYHVTVSGIRKENTLGERSTTIDSATEILPIIQYPRLSTSKFVGSVGYFFLLSLPFFAWIGTTWIRHARHRTHELSKSDRQVIAKKSIALQQLSALRTTIITGNTRETIDQVDNILTEFLRAKWKLTDQVMTKKEWISYLQSQPIEVAVKDKLLMILNDTELALYGGQLSQSKREELIDQVKAIVEQV